MNWLVAHRWLVLLWLATLLSALFVVTVRHQNRLAFVEWRNVESTKAELQAEHGRLLLEKATWTNKRNMVEYAKQRLEMVFPQSEEIVILNLEASR